MRLRRTAQTLKTKFEQYKTEKHFSDDFRLRVHRSLSWLKKAEEENDLDMKFLALWIAFNAAYAREIDGSAKDNITLNEFLLRICTFDEEELIYQLVWQKFPQSIRLLFENKFVSPDFWDFHNQKISEKAYSERTEQEKSALFNALETQKTGKILTLLFKRLYTLRNQLVHGGSTHQSSVNREQVRDGSNILAFLIPAMLDIMMDNHAEINWGTPFYPLVKQ